MKVTIKQQPEFQNIFNQYIKLNNFEFKFLKHYLNQLTESKELIYETSYLFYNEEGWILILHGEVLYIYGENWTDELLNEFEENVNLAQFKNYEVVGSSILIKKLLEIFDIKNNKIIKERLFYRASSINKIGVEENYEIRNANHSEENEIALMLQKYYEEEYNGQNNKEFNKMLIKAKQLIDLKNIFLLIVNTKIVSFCTLINPDIGILFTKVEQRKKGFGKIILINCAEKLLDYNEEIYLMTDKLNVESNIVVKNVGFNTFYEHIQIKINCS